MPGFSTGLSVLRKWLVPPMRGDPLLSGGGASLCGGRVLSGAPEFKYNCEIYFTY